MEFGLHCVGSDEPRWMIETTELDFGDDSGNKEIWRAIRTIL